ncbi:MAG: hypothetical protein U0165_06230 [Polyangiaceae bacterium]
MGRLVSAVRDRVAPFIGFCGGAQILALLEATGAKSNVTPASIDPEERFFPGGKTSFDPLLLRLGNEPIRGVIKRPKPYERAWWSDPPEMDRDRPVIVFDPSDPLFDTHGETTRRSSTRELPSSHGDLLRSQALERGPLRELKVVAYSHFCRPWVREDGPEPTWLMPNGARCIQVPQAFRSVSREGFPLIGFQFHPEQRDFTRLAPGSPTDARGDAMNVFANAVALALDEYIRRWAE